MKNLLLITSLIGLILTTTNSFAQKSFEGTITYGIEYEDLPEEMQGYEAMLPKENVMKIKGSKTRTEQNMGMGSTISIYDRKTESSITLMDMMGQKMAIKMSKEELEKQEKPKEDPKIEYFNETKEIAGYKCKKAEITYGDEETITVYYTDEINASDIKSQYKGLKGFPMQYEISNQGMTMTMTVKEVKKEKISSSEFTIPKDYEITNMEDLQKKMSGQMGGE